MSKESKPAEKPKRRWYQFHLWHLFVLVTVAAIACSWFACKMVEARRQKEAVEAIQDLGAKITFEPMFPGWLQWLPEAKECQRVVAVDLQHCRFEPGAIEPLLRLPDVERLYLTWSSVTDEDLRYVGQLSKVRRLALWQTGVTNNGLAHLRGLKELRLLDIHGSRIDEEGLMHLEHWPKLRLLIQDMTLTDRGLIRLARHPNIPVTGLHAEHVSDRGFEYLLRLRRLETLSIQPECNRMRFKKLIQLRQLKYLKVYGRPDFPLEQLKEQMPKLKFADVVNPIKISFADLGRRWGESAEELEICTTSPYLRRSTRGKRAIVTVTQREPPVAFFADVE